jgi:hypothetical protein
MIPTPRVVNRFAALLLIATATLITSINVFAQNDFSSKGKAVYDQIKAFSLNGGSAEVKGLLLKRDRVNMTFDGTFYFTSAVDGHITGAVFTGSGKFVAEVPPNDFEKANLNRLLGADAVESDFKTAVLRFSDDTLEHIGKNRHDGGVVNDQAQKLAIEEDARTLKETGANIPARITLTLLNGENPGFFFAGFGGGRRGHFSFMMDYQNRIPVANFGINAGEKGLIFSYQSSQYFNEIWMAFYGLEDYQHGTVSYSDTNDLIDIAHYDLNVDLREHKKSIRLSGHIETQALASKLRAISFSIGEQLSEEDKRRLKKQLRIKQARLGGVEIAAVQEDWEGGFTVFLPAVADAGQKLDFEFTLDGDFMYDATSVDNCFYPLSNTSWFPRHGYLDRATFDLRFQHPAKLHVASIGLRLSEVPDVEDKSAVVTRYRMPQPVTFATFALGPFERHKQMVKFENGGDPLPLEFNSLPGSSMAIKEDFILAELNNSIRYFSKLFGKYPYPAFGAAFHPFGFGQGLPSLLMIPNTDLANKFTYSFIAHETSHQWWGNIVSWRSYRDQWLSEGFAEYSGILYTGIRSNAGASNDLLGRLRYSLVDRPLTTTGVGKGRLVDVGPIILGHRLNTSKTRGAYQALIYDKGALVLHMLHFLLTDPKSGNGQPFFDMMTDFVERYRDKAASTDDFRTVANEHFAKSPIAQIYRLKNLDWFFDQWVYKSEMPSYHMDYQFTDQPDGKTLLSGTVTQEHVPNSWFMVLPIVISFGEKQEALATVHAYGPTTTFQIKLPVRPKKVELDPQHWVISEKTSTSAR